MPVDPDMPQEVERLRRRVAELEARIAASSAGTESALRSSLDQAFEGIQILDREWRYVYLNATAARHGRRDEKDLVGRTMLEAYPGIEGTELFAILQKCMNERRPQQMLNPFTYPDGKTAWFDLRIEPVPIGILVLSVDVTAHKSIEESLRRSREDLATTLQCIADGVIATDVGGRVVGMNAAAEQMLGWTEAEGRGRALQDLVQFLNQRTGESVEDPVRRVLHDGLTIGLANETVIVPRGGVRIPIASSAAPIRDAQGTVRGVVLAIRDMREEYALTSMLQQAQKMEAIGRLAGGVAHDFNNLLSVINGYAEILLRELPETDPSAEPIREIRDAGNRAAALTRQLLAFSRKQVLRPEVLDINAVVEKMEKLLHRLIGEDVDLATHLRPEVHPVLADPGQIEQVVMNLVVNARDAMPQGGKLTIETACADLDEEYARLHPFARPGPHTVIAITDTGIGMDAETRARIFEPFFTTKEAGKGTGLGLSTVYGIVKQSGGNVWVYSEPGRGTTFKVYLPRAESAREAAPSSPPAAPARGTGTILVVEDDASVRALLRRLLESAGYTVLEAKDGAEAIEIGERHAGAIRLLLTDVVLPGLGGREVARRLRAQRPEIRVAFMSGYTDDAIVHHGVLDPGTTLIEKPITMKSLLPKVRDLTG